LIVERLKELGYDYEPAPLERLGVFQAAVRTGDLVFTSGQIPSVGETHVKGKVGSDLTLEQAAAAAELCAFNCLRAVGAVADIESLERIVKIFGMVNVDEHFDSTTSVIHGATNFLIDVFGDRGKHARSAVGMVVPGNWAVEIEMIVEVN